MKLRPPAPKITDIEILHGHLFCGLGGGAKGFNRGSARVGSLRAKFRCVGGIDNDPAAIADFTRASGVQGTVRDLFSRDQYEAFHGVPPPPDWSEASPAAIHAAFGNERPHIIFLSAPCKGFFNGPLGRKFPAVYLGAPVPEIHRATSRLTDWIDLKAALL